MDIRLAKLTDLEEVTELYGEICDSTKDSPYNVGWERGVYPTEDFLRYSIDNGHMYVLMDGQCIAGVMILNHEGQDSYADCAWSIKGDKEKIMAVHNLGVRPSYQGRGLSKVLVEELIKIAKGQEQIAIRLDVIAGNVPALKLYESFGFIYRDVITINFGEPKGTLDFLLYEKVL